MRLVFAGSGAFGLPTLERLAGRHEIALVVSQPPRPAGRRRVPTPTPVAARAEAAGLEVFTPERPNEPAAAARIRGAAPDALIVIAYGHKLGPALLEGLFAINLHASLLPKYRGAAPINWAMIENEAETGVSVITLARRMDAGDVLARRATPIDPRETAGELHDRLAALGPGAIDEVLERRAAGTLVPEPQDEARATLAPKLAKADGTVRLDQPAARVRARVHGLTPWPGCWIALGGRRVRLARVESLEEHAHDAAPGTVLPGHLLACAPGAVRVLEAQAEGGRPMPFEDFLRGHELAADARAEALAR